MADNPYLQFAEQDAASAAPAPQPAAGDNPYMDLAKSDLEQTQQQIRGILDVVSPIDPNKAAEAVKLSRSSGLPEQTVSDNLDEVKKQERIRLLNLQQLMTSSPVLARQLMDPNFAKLAQDNVERMSDLEMAASYFGRSVASGVVNLTAAGTKLLDKVQPFTTSEEELAVLFKNDPAKLKEMRENGAATALSRWALDQQKLANQIMDNAPDQVKAKYGSMQYLTTDTENAAYLSPVKIISDVAQSLPTTLALMASMYLTKSAAGNTYSAMIEAGATREVAIKEAGRVAAEAMAKYSAASEGAVGYAQQANETRAEADKISLEKIKQNPEYWELIDKEGFSPEAARIYLSAKASESSGSMAGLADAITNFYGGRFLGKYISEGGALLPRTGKGFLTEALTEAPQSMGEKLGENMAIQEYLDRSQSATEGVGEAGAAGFFIGGLTGGGFSAALGGMEHNDQKAAQANTVFDLLTRINELAGADIVRQRDVQTFAGFMQAVQDEHGGDVNTLYIAPQTLLDTLTAAGADINAVVQSVPSLANLKEQAANGTDIAIPVADFATHIAGSDYAQAIMPHLKADPTGMTKVEADEYMKNHGEKLKAEVEQVLAQQENKAEFKASMDKVKAEVKAQLDETQRFRSDVTDAYAQLMASFYAVTGAKIGLSPEEMAAKYPIKVASKGEISDQQYDQSGQLKTETSNFKNWFKSSKVVDANGKAKVMYHGTAQDIRAFKAKQAGAIFVTENAGFADDFTEMSKDWMVDHYEDILSRSEVEAAKDAAERYIREEFANDPDKADLLAHEMRVGDRLTNPKARVLFNKAIAEQMPSGPNILPVYVSAQNPFDYENPEHVAAVVAELNKSSNQWGEPRGDKAKGFLERGNWEEIEKDVTQKAIKAAGFDGFYVKEGKEKNLAVYDPAQIKSVFNNGEYDPNNPEILHQKDQPLIGEGEVKRVMKRELGEFTPEEQAAWDEFMAGRPDADRILANLKEHAGTPWAKQATEGVFTRQAMLMLIKGQTPNFQSSLESGQVKRVRETLAKKGIDGLWQLLEADGGMMGAAAKPVNNVNSSFINCDPSADCAKYCYATGGNYRYANVVVKSELVTLAVELDPVRAAQRVAREYKATAEFANNKALRLYDKGDGNEAWLPFIKELNKEGIRTQIFSKVPEFLRQVPEMNLRLLSIDNSNMAMADANPDLPVAFVYTGKEQIDMLAKLAARGQIQVVLPVKLGQKLLDGSEVNDLKKAVPEVKPYLCPIDAGFKKLGKTSQQGTWNCTKCDVNGGVGCFHGNATKAQMASLEAKPATPQERAQRILELRSLINEFTSGAANTLAESGRVPQGGVEGLLHEVDSLLGELLRDYDSGTEAGATGQAGRGVGFQIGGAQAGVSGRRVIPIKPVRDASGDQASDGSDSAELKQGEGEARGSFNPETNTITLLKAANLSTFLHEAGHFFLEVNADIALQANAPAEIVQDMQKVIDWFGVEDLQTWSAMTIDQKRPYHEQFARGFEAYLMEGKSPSLELQGVFQRFRSWLVNIYKQISGLNVQLDDEIRGVFDRMLASSEAIQQAEAARSFAPIFTSKPPFMTDDEWTAYQQTDMQSSQDAVQDLETKSLQDMRWLSNAKSKLLKSMQRENAELRKDVRREVEAEVMAEPVYRAREFFKRGMLDRQPVETPVKLSIPEIEAMYEGNPIVGAIKNALGFGKYGMLGTENGMHPEQAAELFGFTSGDHLIRSLLEAPDPRTVIEQRTDSRMLERYGDINSPQALSRAADEAIHNDARARFVATEANALAKAVGKPKLVTQAAKAYAEQIISRLKIRDIRAGQYAASAARAGKEANKAMTVASEGTEAAAVKQADAAIYNAKQRLEAVQNGKEVTDTNGNPLTLEAAQRALAAAQTRKDTATQRLTTAQQGPLTVAATEKRNQLINTYAAKAAYAAQDEVIRGVRYLQRFDSKNIAKNVHIDSLEQIWAILDRFDLRRSTSLKQLDRRRSLIEWVEMQRAKGEEPIVPQDLLNEAYKVSYKDMTLEDFRGLIESVQNIEHLGRLKSKLIKIQDQREFKAVSGQASETIRENATGSIEDELEKKGLKNAVTSNGREVLAWHRKFASLIRQMDGFKDGGFLWSIFVKPMNEAGTQEASMREGATVKLAELYKLLKGVNLDKKVFIPEIGKSLSFEGRIGIALNMGNETNMQRVLEGEGWSPEQVQAILKPLTREHWQFVQGVWDHINSYWPEIAAKERRLTGVVPEKVQAREFIATAADGTQITMAGGYYPIKYNSDRSSKAAADNAADVLKQMERGLYARAQTARGHLQARVDSVGRPMRYDLGVIDQHLNQVIHDLSWHEYLIDANRLLSADSIDAAIREHYGPEVLKVMKKTLEDIAIGELPTQGTIERGVRYFRSGVSIAAMGWNLSTAFLQPLGLTQSMVRVGPKWVAKGMGRWLRDASSMESTVQWVGEKSEFMRLRAKTMQREISEIRNTISKGETMTAVEGSFFYLIGKLQLVADIPTWIGMYEKAMAAGNNEDRAIALADQAVLDSQGGGQIKDLSMVQRGGEWQKLWTNFYSFFNVTYNQLAESVGETQKVGASRLPLLAADFLMLTIVPATLGFFLKAALKGTLGDDDEDKLLKKLAAENISYLFGMMIGLRETSAAISGSMGYEGPAGARIFAGLGKFGTQVSQGEADEAFWRSANDLGGVLLHYPALQIDRTVRGFIELSEGGENPLALLFGPKPKN